MTLSADDLDFDTALALLDWQLGMGVSETISDLPVDRYALAQAAPPAAAAVQVSRPEPAAGLPPPLEVDTVAEAQAIAAAAADLDSLASALRAFEHCELKRGARQLVLSDGHPQADIMLIGDAPGRDEDRVGRPFAGPVGQLLDRMLAAVDLSRESPDPSKAVYLTNVLPWRVPENRGPTAKEVAMMLPFLLRQIELVQPKLLVLLGGPVLTSLTGQSDFTRLRGQWTTAAGLPALPVLHPIHLLRQPGDKKLAWGDLLVLKARLIGR